MQGVLLLLISAAALFGQSVSQLPRLSTCSNILPLGCASDPCETARCPRIVSGVECCPKMRPDGTCIAVLSKLGRLLNPMDCWRNSETCDNKVCDARLTCMEQEVNDCPQKDTECGLKTIKAICVPTPSVLPVASCEDVSCTEPSTVCLVKDGRRGPVASCVCSIPENCEEMECDEGMRCVMKARPIDNKVVPRCVLKLPEDCSNIECVSETTKCVMLENGKPACIQIPTPKRCDMLDCGPNMECKEVKRIGRNGVERVRRVQCVPLPTEINVCPRITIELSCSQLDCESGSMCVMVSNPLKNGRMLSRPRCVPMQCPMKTRKLSRPPMDCNEIVCGKKETCVLCGEGKLTRARCVPDNDLAVNTNHDLLVTTVVPPMPTRRPPMGTGRPNIHPTPPENMSPLLRRPPMSCEELECGEMEVCKELEIPDSKKIIAKCISEDNPVTCEELRCEEREWCLEVLDRLDNTVNTLAICMKPSICLLNRPDRMISSVRPDMPRPSNRPNRPRPSNRPDRPRSSVLPNRPLPSNRPDIPMPSNRPTIPPTECPEVPALRCEDLDCGRGLECRTIRIKGRQIARCIREHNEICRRVDIMPTTTRMPMPTTTPMPMPTTTPKLEVELDENGNKKVLIPTTTPMPMPTTTPKPEVELDENGNKKVPTTTPMIDENGKKKRPITTPKPNPLITTRLTNLNLPDRCSERQCCKGETCVVRKLSEDRPAIALCVPNHLVNRPLTCEELECEEGLVCKDHMMDKDETTPIKEKEMSEENDRDKHDRETTPIEEEEIPKDRNVIVRGAKCVRVSETTLNLPTTAIPTTTTATRRPLIAGRPLKPHHN